MEQSIEQALTGGHPNSLGNTVAVVEQVLANPIHMEELFQCYFSTDEVVRLRVSNAMKRIAKERRELLIPYLERFLTDISPIDQASTQWTLAQLFERYTPDLTSDQRQRARAHLQTNLATATDWIVLNSTIETLGKWSQKDSKLQAWLRPHLERLSKDNRKSVAKRAQKWLQHLPA